MYVQNMKTTLADKLTAIINIMLTLHWKHTKCSAHFQILYTDRQRYSMKIQKAPFSGVLTLTTLRASTTNSSPKPPTITKIQAPPDTTQLVSRVPAKFTSGRECSPACHPHLAAPCYIRVIPTKSNTITYNTNKKTWKERYNNNVATPKCSLSLHRTHHSTGY